MRGVLSAFVGELRLCLTFSLFCATIGASNVCFGWVFDDLTEWI